MKRNLRRRLLQLAFLLRSGRNQAGRAIAGTYILGCVDMTQHHVIQHGPPQLSLQRSSCLSQGKRSSLPLWSERASLGTAGLYLTLTVGVERLIVQTSQQTRSRRDDIR